MTRIPTALHPLAAVDGEQLARLRTSLAREAWDDGVVDVAYRTMPSPVGELLLAGTPQGLAYIAFAVEDFDAVLDRLAASLGGRVLRAEPPLDDAVRELDEYFEGNRRSFDLRLDLSLAHGFRADVLERLRDVEYGSTVSYAELASRAGRPRAVRAAGSACATNPVPLVVPCHRVLRSDGAVGGYRGGAAAKRLLLDLEAGGR